MQMNFDTLRDKVMGCWIGKNVGGVLGAPMEGQRRTHEITYYLQDLDKHGAPPNDDLDLQLVWLNAVEKFGLGINRHVLAEYWLSYIIPDWVEYGTGKRNLRAGWAPPASGALDNVYRNSCGCFIRSEIWACLAPGHPEIAARLAWEDGCVDHSEEGLAAEVFCAALQSAAFVESDPRRLIDIALSYVPENSRLRRGVETVMEAHREGADWKEARRRVRSAVPGTFGVLFWQLHDPANTAAIMADGPIGEAGFDAPENVAYVILGWLYGEGDFGRSICAAVNCGEDTDCTGATLGALHGIIHGAKALPEKWVKPLGNKIVHMCVNRTNGGVDIPETIEDLTRRTLRQIPTFLGPHVDLFAEGPGFTTEMREGDGLMAPGHKTPLPIPEGLATHRPAPRELPSARLAASPWRVYHHGIAFDAVADPGPDLYYKPGTPKKLRVEVTHNGNFNQQFWCEVRLHLPPHVRSETGAAFRLPVQNLHGSRGICDLSLEISPYGGATLDIGVEIRLLERAERAWLPLTLLKAST